MKRLFASLALVLPLVAHAGFDDAVQAYGTGDYAKALAEFRVLADQGKPEAQYFMGLFYHNGFGVPRDQNESARWFLEPAELTRSFAPRDAKGRASSLLFIWVLQTFLWVSNAPPITHPPPGTPRK